VTTVLGSGNDPFQPSVIPFNVGVITCGYLAGVALVRPWRSRRTKALVRVGSDDSYGIYLSQILFIATLSSLLGWERLTSVLPWPVVCLLAVVIVFSCAIALTGLLARTPLAVPLTGRRQQPWSTLIPGRRPIEEDLRTRNRLSPTRSLRTSARGGPAGARDRGLPRADTRLPGSRSPGARHAGGHDEQQERILTVISQWIEEAAARQGGAPYLAGATTWTTPPGDAAGSSTLTYAGLRRSTAAWAQCLDRADVPPGASVAVRMADPLGYATALVASSAPAG
jgi:hypothetical protein